MFFLIMYILFFMSAAYGMDKTEDPNEMPGPDFFVDMAIAKELSSKNNNTNQTTNQASVPTVQATQPIAVAGPPVPTAVPLQLSYRILKYSVIGIVACSMLTLYGYVAYQIALGPNQDQFYPIDVTSDENSISQSLETIKNILKSRNC